MMAASGDRDTIERCARQVAAAIAARDTDLLRTLFADGFVHRAPGGPVTELTAFLEAIAAIPGEILSIRLDSLCIDIVGDGAIATGIQHAEVKVDGQVIADRRGFIDWFIKTGNIWQIRVAIDLPAAGDVK